MLTRWKRLTSFVLALVMVFSLLPVQALAVGVNDSLVSSLAEVYDGDEARAREDLEALYAAGLLDDQGTLVELEIREDGEAAELEALADRISNSEPVGRLTVNGNDAEPEQIVKISQVKAALEIAELLDEEIDATDEHVENLESLLSGIQDGSVDLNSALRTGSMKLNSGNKVQLFSQNSGPEDKTLKDGRPETVPLTQDQMGYIASYISNGEYNPAYEFKFDHKIPAEYFDEGTEPASYYETTTENNVRMDNFNWSGAIFGADDSDPTYTTVTVVLPLNDTVEVQNWLASESGLVDITENGIGVEMDLPGLGTVNATKYFNNMFFAENLHSGRNTSQEYHHKKLC